MQVLSAAAAVFPAEGKGPWRLGKRRGSEDEQSPRLGLTRREGRGRGSRSWRFVSGHGRDPMPACAGNAVAEFPIVSAVRGWRT